MSISKNNNVKKIKKLFLGENLTILNQILPKFKSKVKCIYIDPPYNNGELYKHYDDRISDKWLSNLKARIKIMYEFLKDNGCMWISIDDNEMHYLKVSMDQIFGRNNFVTTIIWQQRTSRENRKPFSNNHEYILVYAKNKKLFDKTANKLKVTDEILKRYKNPDNDFRGNWQSISINVQAGHAVKSQFYKIKSPSGKIFDPPPGRCWAYNKKKLLKLVKEKRIWFGKNGDSAPRYKKFLSESNMGTTPETIWFGNEVGTNDEAKKEILSYSKSKIFETPKPKKLIEKIFKISTDKNDLILDAYAGSGTSAVVANDMNLQFIAIDQGKHFLDFTLKRINNSKKTNSNEKIEIYKIKGDKIIKK